MAVKVSEIRKHERRDSLRASLEKNFRIKTRGFSEEVSRSIESANQTLPVSNQPPTKMLFRQSLIDRWEGKDPKFTTEQANNTSNSILPKEMLTIESERIPEPQKQTPKPKCIRKVDPVAEYEAAQNDKFRTFFKSTYETELLVNKKITVHKQIRDSLPPNKQRFIYEDSLGEIDDEKFSFMGNEKMKDAVYESQKRAIKVQFQREMQKYGRERQSGPPKSLNDLDSSSKDYYKLCKTLNVDKIIAQGDQPKLDLDQHRTPEKTRVKVLNDELRSILHSFRGFHDDYSGTKASIETNGEMRQTRLPPIEKEKNIHVERLRKLSQKSAKTYWLANKGNNSICFPLGISVANVKAK